METIQIIDMVLNALIIPLVGFMIRFIVRWTKVESKLDQTIEEMKEIRKGTDRRLRWLEENLWKRGGGNVT